MSVFKGKQKKELEKDLEEKQGKLREFRFAMSGGKIKNVNEGKMLRKDIARILTELNSTK